MRFLWASWRKSLGFDLKEKAGHAASHSLKEKQHFKSMGNVFRADENSIKMLQRTIGKQKTNTLLQSKECLQYCPGAEGNPQCSLALLKNKQKNAFKLVCIKHRVWIVTFLFQVRSYHLVAHGTMRMTCLQRYQWSLDPQLYQRRDIWLQCPISTSSHQIHKLPFLLGYILSGSQDSYPGNNWYPCYYSPVRESDTGREA